jgi:hypothetical protein
VEPDHPESGSESRRARRPIKIEKVKKFHVLKCWKAEGFSCSLDVLYGGLGISKLQFLIQKMKKNVQLLFFFNFWSSNPGSGMDPDPDRYSAGSGINEFGS